jgi:acetyl esterase/lipase
MTLALLNVFLKVAVKPKLSRTATPLQARQDFARMAQFYRAPPFLLHLPGRGNLPLAQISVGPVRDDAVILYLHGGAYLAGSPRTHSAMLGRLAKLTGLRVLAPRYRLAPEHPAPAAFDDANAAYSELLRQGYRPDQIILGGDSAGGGLALALLAHLCAQGQQPLALFAFSPWTDLTQSGESLRSNAALDPLLPVARIAEAVGFVKGDLAADDPRISPLFADFLNPPPVHMFVGSTEILRDDTLRMAENLRRAGGDVRVTDVKDAPHVWPLFDGFIAQARVTLQEVAGFIAAQLSARRP